MGRPRAADRNPSGGTGAARRQATRRPPSREPEARLWEGAGGHGGKCLYRETLPEHCLALGPHGTTFLVVTHSRDLASQMPRTVHMRDGRIDTDQRNGS